MMTAHTTSRSTEQIVDAIRAAAGEQQLYGLLDLASAPDALKQVTHGSGDEARSLFERTGNATASHVGPWLLRFGQDSSGHARLVRSIASAPTCSAISWIASNLPIDDLAARLAARLEATLLDGERILLRFYDPRVLPVLHQVLAPEQREVFFALGASWHYLGREGDLRHIALTPPGTDDPFDAPQPFTTFQMDALFDAAEVDSVMPQLVRYVPEQFMALSGVERYRFTQKSLRRAAEYKLDHFSDKVLLCALALRLGETFDELPAWQTELNEVRSGKRTLGEAVKRVEAASSKGTIS